MNSNVKSVDWINKKWDNFQYFSITIYVVGTNKKPLGSNEYIQCVVFFLYGELMKNIF